jgi:hypothetical protein
LEPPVINDRGEVAFFAEMTSGAADFGIFRGEGGTLTPVLVANQIAPGGATFEDFSDPVRISSWWCGPVRSSVGTC